LGWKGYGRRHVIENCERVEEKVGPTCLKGMGILGLMKEWVGTENGFVVVV
jgi:hypothetical protein